MNLVTTETNLRRSWRAYIDSAGFWQARNANEYHASSVLPTPATNQNGAHIKWGPELIELRPPNF